MGWQPSPQLKFRETNPQQHSAPGPDTLSLSEKHSGPAMQDILSTITARGARESQTNILVFRFGFPNVGQTPEVYVFVANMRTKT